MFWTRLTQPSDGRLLQTEAASVRCSSYRRAFLAILTLSFVASAFLTFIPQVPTGILIESVRSLWEALLISLVIAVAVELIFRVKFYRETRMIYSGACIIR